MRRSVPHILPLRDAPHYSSDAETAHGFCG
jgi:hypothetical protein